MNVPFNVSLVFYGKEVDSDFLRERIFEYPGSFEIDANAPIIGRRYDAKTLYTSYSEQENYQERFEMTGSDTIYKLSAMMKADAYNIVDLIVYATIRRQRIAERHKHVFAWRTGSVPMMTTMSTHEREQLKSIACQNPLSIPGEMIVEEGSIYFVTGWNKKILSLDTKNLFNYVCSHNRRYLPLSIPSQAEEIISKAVSSGIFKDGYKELGILGCSLNLYLEEEKPDVDYLLMLEHLYQNCLKDSSLSKKIRRIGKLHYYLCLKTPIERGGGSLAEWICGALLFNADVGFIGWSVEVWNYAVTRNLSQFLEEYSEYISVS